MYDILSNLFSGAVKLVTGGNDSGVIIGGDDEIEMGYRVGGTEYVCDNSRYIVSARLLTVADTLDMNGTDEYYKKFLTDNFDWYIHGRNYCDDLLPWPTIRGLMTDIVSEINDIETKITLYGYNKNNINLQFLSELPELHSYIALDSYQCRNLDVIVNIINDICTALIHCGNMVSESPPTTLSGVNPPTFAEPPSKDKPPKEIILLLCKYDMQHINAVKQLEVEVCKIINKLNDIHAYIQKIGSSIMV